MGVLNFSGTLRHTPPTRIDLLSLDVNLPNEVYSDPIVENTAQNVSRNKRKRTKSCCKSQYNFEDYGIDERRRGSKHQRRKQNFHELQEMVGDDALEETWLLDNKMTLFAELFLDENKMKIWEGFIGLSEDKQGQYIEEFETQKVNRKTFNKVSSNHDEDDGDCDDDGDVKYLLIDQKIRDMLRSKQLSNNVNGLLKYYEDDVLSCIDDASPPAVLILNLESAYDRMLVYAVCQYMKLSASTIKLKTSTIIGIELDEESAMNPEITLTEYLRENASRLV